MHPLDFNQWIEKEYLGPIATHFSLSTKELLLPSDNRSDMF